MPDASVVAVTGEPFAVTTFPAESNNVTVKPTTGSPVVPNVSVPARPDNVPPHCATAGAETVVEVLAGVSVVTTLEASVAVALAIEVAVTEGMVAIGPSPAGHTTCAVRCTQSCGASPIAVMVAVGATE